MTDTTKTPDSGNKLVTSGPTKKNTVNQNDPKVIEEAISKLMAKAHSARADVENAEMQLALLNLDEKITEAEAVWQKANADAKAKIDAAEKNIDALKKKLETAKAITKEEVAKRKTDLGQSEEAAHTAQEALNKAKKELREKTEAKNAAEKTLTEALEILKKNEQRYQDGVAALYKVQTPEEQEAALKAQMEAQTEAQRAVEAAQAELTKLTVQCEVDTQTAEQVFLEAQLKYNREKSDLLKAV